MMTEYNLLLTALSNNASEEKVKFLVTEAGAIACNEANNNNTLSTALLYKASEETLKFLVTKAGATACNEANNNNTLYIALRRHASEEMLKFLVKEAEATACNEANHNNTLYIALRSSVSAEMLKFLVTEAGATACNETNNNNTLCIALRSSVSAEMLKFLVTEAGATACNEANNDNTLSTALEYNASEKIIDMLLLHGADPNTLEDCAKKENLISRQQYLMNFKQASNISDEATFFSHADNQKESTIYKLPSDLLPEIAAFAAEKVEGSKLSPNEIAKAAIYGINRFNEKATPGTRVEKITKKDFAKQVLSGRNATEEEKDHNDKGI